MIKWKGKNGDRPIVGIGLEEGNVMRLRNGMPLLVNGREMGLDFDILVHYGRDAGSMLRDLKSGGLIDKDTNLHMLTTNEDEGKPRQ